MQYDRRGIALTTRSISALTHLDAATTSLLTHRRDTAEHLAAALAADPDLAAAHCLAGFLALLLGRAELLPAARSALHRAKAALALRAGTLREQVLTEALACWCDGDMELAADRLDESLVADPLDAMTAKLVQSLRFMLGDASGMRRSVEAILPAWSESVSGYGLILGCHAFALEETDALDAAERAGRMALEREPFDVWACHAVAHVHEARGATAPGIAWITAHEGRWIDVNNFARHMDWHRALFHLARNENGTVLALYDRKIRNLPSDDYRDITNAAALLYRLEAHGVGVGQRWTELADLAERRINDHALAFAQLHYLICLVGARRWDAAYHLFAAMDLEARSGLGTQARLLADIGVPLAKTILAGSGAGVAWNGNLARLGGSRAQRQTFERILRDAKKQQEQPTQRLASLHDHAMDAGLRTKTPAVHAFA
jgi:hypothetical protein